MFYATSRRLAMSGEDKGGPEGEEPKRAGKDRLTRNVANLYNGIPLSKNNLKYPAELFNVMKMKSY